MIYGKGTQLQAALTQNGPRVDDLNFTTSHLRITILNMFSSITFFPDEEFFHSSFHSCKEDDYFIKIMKKNIGHLVRLGENGL